MKFFWILRYLLRLGTLNIGTKINVENLYTPKKLIQNDISLRVNQLAKDHLNIEIKILLIELLLISFQKIYGMLKLE